MFSQSDQIYISQNIVLNANTIYEFLVYSYQQRLLKENT